MTKKRFKFGLAILGLAAFLLALLALVFVPTGASAGKGPVFGQEQDGGEHSGHPNPAYFDPPYGNRPNNPHHSDDGAGPCVGALCDNHDNGAPGEEAWHYAGGQDGQGNGPGQDEGNGHSPNNDSGNQGGQGNPWFAGGGYPGGGYPGGYGTPRDGSGSCASKKDKDEDSKDKESGDKTCDSDDGNKDNSNNSGDTGGNDAGHQQLTLLDDNNPFEGTNDDTSGDPSGDTTNNLLNDDSPRGDDDLPPVDPNCFPFAESCDTHNGNPPNTVLTDPPTEVPEPLTLSLFTVGLTGVAALRRRSRQKTAAQLD